MGIASEPGILPNNVPGEVEPDRTETDALTKLCEDTKENVSLVIVFVNNMSINFYPVSDLPLSIIALTVNFLCMLPFANITTLTCSVLLVAIIKDGKLIAIFS
jgi:hypothetical protein